MENLPILAVTTGDPAGSGPEITVKALNHREIYDICRPLVIGDSAILHRALIDTGLRDFMRINTVDNPCRGLYQYGTIDLYDMHLIDDAEKIKPGAVNALAGESSNAAGICVLVEK